MFRKPLFWVVFALLSAGCAFFAARYFSHAFPIVSIDLRMNREAALERARALQAKYAFGPSGFREVASFQQDQEVQNFVELEGGGTAALTRMFTTGLYHPFRWGVRHFREGETRETRLSFTPRGDPYGFSVRLPEKEAGAALAPEQAQSIAERSAPDWGVNLSEYRLVEKSREVRPGGRIDHSFVYERPDRFIGAGRYRLRLGVGGDRLTELRHFVKVPEAFTRRYEEMRAANTAITVSGAVMMLVYVVGGLGVGLFFLMRQRWIIWRTPVMWGIFIAFLQLLAEINNWPLRWLNYDTAVSVAGFTAQQAATMLLMFGLYALLFSLSFMAAESLTRRAFPHHPQLWRLWDTTVASSKSILGRTAAAYLIVAIFFAYEVILYFVTNRYLGWWSPSDTLVNPDVLASYLPWLSPIAISAQAGFWEECLFRAVPLAGAALLGTRFGRRNWWIIGAMVVQALVFGTGHASYANQPSYARVVELILPSFVFGGLYLAFGLWPAIVMHFAYDVVWFAIPLFVSTAPGIWLDRGLLIALALVPLWVVLVARYRARSWTELRESFLNRGWRPAEPLTAVPDEAPQERAAVRPGAYRYIPIAGVAGLVLWGLFSPLRTDAPPVNVSRAQAEAIARQELRNRGIELGPGWKVLPNIAAGTGEEHRFVWQTSGREAYRSLLGEYLPEPHWTVRFARFQGDVAERAEEYLVTVTGSGRTRRFKHTLPEDKAAPSLAEPEARDLALRSLREIIPAAPNGLKEVSAAPQKLKGRTDWLFTFQDTRTQLREGEARLGVQIAGNELVDRYRFVHIPEEWSRRERDRRVVPGILEVISRVLLIAAAVAGVIVAVVSWSRRRFAVPFFLVVALAGAVSGSVAVLNRFPSLAAQFSTAQPYRVQVAIFIIAGLVATILAALAIGLMGGLAKARAAVRESIPGVGPLAAAISLGAAAAGITATVSLWGRKMGPVWADYSALGSYSRWLDAVVTPVSGYLSQAIILLLLMVAVDRLTRGWSRRRAAGYGAFLLAGIAAAGAAESILSWVVRALVIAVLASLAYLLVMRFHPAQAVVAVASYAALGIVTEGIARAYPHAIPDALLRAAALGATAWLVYRKFAISKEDSLGSHGSESNQSNFPQPRDTA